jgi:hypothetical protein
MSARLFFLILCAAHVSGCARFHHKRATPAAMNGPRLVGTVTLVNDALRFVLVDVGTLYVPEPGAALKCFAGGQETAVLAVSPERKRPFITADIVKGTPHPGDQVFE